MYEVYTKLRKRFFDVCESQNLLSESVQVKARVLSSEEAIGKLETDDFPIQKGKERLMQAEFGTGTGQAFTDRYGDFSGKLSEVIDMPLENNFRWAVFVAALTRCCATLMRSKVRFTAMIMGRPSVQRNWSNFSRTAMGNSKSPRWASSLEW